jgi:hypothetical protein
MNSQQKTLLSTFWGLYGLTFLSPLGVQLLTQSFEIKDESELIGTWRGEMKDHTSVIRPVAKWEIKFLSDGNALPNFRYKIKDGKVELTTIFGKKILFSKSFGSLVSEPTYEYGPIKLKKID